MKNLKEEVSAYQTKEKDLEVNIETKGRENRKLQDKL